MTDDHSTAPTWYEATRVASPQRERLGHDLDVDVCVIGAGLAGLTAAREVARRGWSVVVLEGSSVGAAASGRNTGFVLPGYSEGIDDMVERDDKDIVEVYANLWVERDSQKGIIIGKGGARLQEVGARAREGIEPLVGTQVYLSLRVKVAPNWQRDPKHLTRLGF